MGRLLDRCRRMGEGEEGFTIIEVLVAAIILVLGSLAVFMTFAAAIHNVQRSKETQVGLSVAQREMEKVRVLDFDEIGLSTTPAASADAKSPNNRVRVGGAGQSEFDLARGTAAQEFQPLTIVGAVPRESTGVRSADGTEVTVFRFVTCEEVLEASCVAKRIVIDVLPSRPGNISYDRRYYELQSTVVRSGESE